MALTPVKHKGEDVESYEKLQQRELSHVKQNCEDVKSYEKIKQRKLSPMKHTNRYQYPRAQPYMKARG